MSFKMVSSLPALLRMDCRGETGKVSNTSKKATAVIQMRDPRQG